MHRALAEPPQGAVAGENVARESEPDEYDRNAVDQAVGVLKTREAYQGKSDDELREIAKEKLST